MLAGAIGEEAAAASGALWLPTNLNDVTNDEILVIPGVGDRMAHEFEEYRPYVDMGEFRLEIGKYVDESEVARFERYVTLNQPGKLVWSVLPLAVIAATGVATSYPAVGDWV